MILAFFCFSFLLLILHCNDFIFRFNSLHCLKTIKFFIHSDFQRRITWCHFAEIVVFSNQEKVAIKKWSSRKRMEHPTKSWNIVSVYRLLKRFQEDNSMYRRAGSGRQWTITAEENENLIKNLICSQEDNPRVQVRKKDEKKEPEPWRIGLGRVVLSKNLYGKVKRILLWMFLETLKTVMSMDLKIKTIFKIIAFPSH